MTNTIDIKIFTTLFDGFFLNCEINGQSKNLLIILNPERYIQTTHRAYKILKYIAENKNNCTGESLANHLGLEIDKFTSEIKDNIYKDILNDKAKDKIYFSCYELSKDSIVQIEDLLFLISIHRELFQKENDRGKINKYQFFISNIENSPNFKADHSDETAKEYLSKYFRDINPNNFLDIFNKIENISKKLSDYLWQSRDSNISDDNINKNIIPRKNISEKNSDFNFEKEKYIDDIYDIMADIMVDQENVDARQYLMNNLYEVKFDEWKDNEEIREKVRMTCAHLTRLSVHALRFDEVTQLALEEWFDPIIKCWEISEPFIINQRDEFGNPIRFEKFKKFYIKAIEFREKLRKEKK